MKQFIVVYEAFNGGMQFFGPFSSRESANKWITDDYIECVNSYKESVKEEPECSITANRAVIEGYGEWFVDELLSV